MVYAYAMLTVNDAAALDAYREVAGEALARHGGRVEHATRDLTVLDGTPEVPDVGALLSFPDRESAQSWATDPDLADIHGLRRSADASNIVLLA